MAGQLVDKLTEIGQPITINQTAKRIHTDLADRLCKCLGRFDPLGKQDRRARAIDVADLPRSDQDGA